MTAAQADATHCTSCGAAVPPGHRFCGLCGSPLAKSPEERRWVTILFADLAGFTTWSEDLDPEDVRVGVDAIMNRLVPVVKAHGGWVNRVIGDALLAVFGAPTAHEDDAERAVRAALAMQHEMRTGGPAGTSAGFAVRVGVNSGEVMLGTVGAELTVMGDAVNTAARLQTAARPGQVLVGGTTRAACGAALQFRPAGELTVKGKQRPVTAYEPVADPARTPSRREIGDAPLVGRSGELATLTESWRAARAGGSPHTVLVVGEAGIGKSRLVAEWVAAVREDEGTAASGRCLPYGEILGYRALAEAIFVLAEVDPSAPEATVRSRLAAFATACGLDPAVTVEHLAVVTGLADGAAVNQVRLHTTIRSVLEAAARRRPLVLFLDDIHWADDALLDLLENIAQRAADAPLVVVAAARPELLEARPWWEKPRDRHAEIRLGSLDPVAAARLATVLCGRHQLPVHMAPAIEKAAGGNPLFAEEVAAVLTRDQDRDTAGLPGSLKASIAARLDKLPADERTLLGLASVVGQEFWRAAVEALGAGAGVGSVLARVELRGLLHRTGHDGGREDGWTFKHGLVRDVAYEMLPRARRRELHGMLLDWIVAAPGERPDAGLLAHHALAAERFDAALGYLDAAAEQARRAAAHRAEAGRLGECLALAERLGRADLTAALYARRGHAWARIGVWPDARRDLKAALAEQAAPLLGEERAAVEVELSEVCFWLADTGAQRLHAAAGLELAERADRADLAAGALAVLAQAQQSEGDLAGEKETFRAAIARAGGFTIGPLAGAPLAFYLAGDIEEALALAEQAVASTDAARDVAFTMWALSYLGLSLAANGRYAEADTVYRRARRYGDEHTARPLTCRAVAMSAGFRNDVGDMSGALALAGEAVERAAAVSFAPTFLQAKIDLLFAYARGGEPGRAERLVREVDEGIATLNNWHEWLWRLRTAQAKAELHLAARNAEAAVPYAAEALARARSHGRRKYEADALAALGRAGLALGRREAAERHLGAASAVAAGVGDPALLLRVSAAVLAGSGPLPDDMCATASRTEAAATARIRVGLPAEMVPGFEQYRERLLDQTAANR